MRQPTAIVLCLLATLLYADLCGAAREPSEPYPPGREPVIPDDPRRALSLTEVEGKYPQMKSIGRVLVANDTSASTGVLVTKCHFLMNLHAISGLRTDPTGRSVTELTDGALALTDEELSRSDAIAISIALLPNGARDTSHGFAITLVGRVVKTGRQHMGRLSGYEGAIPEMEDWAIIRIGNPQLLASFVPVDIASDEEIALASHKSLMAGYPAQLIGANGQQLFFQHCPSKTTWTGFQYRCVATAGNSGSPVLVNLRLAQRNVLKIVGLVKEAKYIDDELMGAGVPASSFRSAVETLRQDPCR